MRLSALVACALSALTACRKQLPREQAAPSAAAAAASNASALRAAEVSRALAEVARKARRVEPRSVPAQQFAFGKAALAWLAGSEVIAFAPQDGKELARWALPDPQRVIGLGDGSLLAIGRTLTQRWAPGQKRPQVFARVPAFPHSVLFAHRVKPDRFWLQPGFGPALYGFQLGSTDLPILPMLQTVEAQGYERGAFSSLYDGSFVYWAAPHLRRFFPGGRSTEVRVPSGLVPWRVLPTERLDRLWVVDALGRLMRAELGPSLRLLTTLELGRVPVEATSSRRDLALVSVSSARGADDFTVDVYDPKGVRRFTSALPQDEPEPGAGDVLELVTQNQNAVLSELEPLLAVGGPTRLCVWQTERGERLWCTERRPEQAGRRPPL